MFDLFRKKRPPKGPFYNPVDAYYFRLLSKKHEYEGQMKKLFPEYSRKFPELFNNELEISFLERGFCVYLSKKGHARIVTPPVDEGGLSNAKLAHELGHVMYHYSLIAEKPAIRQQCVSLIETHKGAYEIQNFMGLLGEVVADHFVHLLCEKVETHSFGRYQQGHDYSDCTEEITQFGMIRGRILQSY